MNQRVKRIIKVVVFAAVAIVLLVVVNFIAQPVWRTQDYNSTHAIYDEPDNTIETLFVGASHIRCGISPMQLYEDYGICSYDLSTDNQPVLASYFWLEEIYRLHSDTLDTVVFDVSTLRDKLYTSYTHIAVDPMEFSMVKLRAVRAYSDDFTDFLNNLFPVLSYHERWKELTEEDFTKYEDEPEIYQRGNHFRTRQWIKKVSDFSEVQMPLLFSDDTVEDAELNELMLEYFDDMVSFCEEHDLHLVLIKAPTAWDSSEHNAMQTLADKYGLDFLDFNVEPFYSDVGLNIATDTIDPPNLSNLHLNYYGCRKLTDYMGKYLIEKCGNRDVRGDESYAFMEDELTDFHRNVVSMETEQLTDPCEYLEYVLGQGDNTIFLSVKNDAANALTTEQREYFASVGLTKLAELDYGNSYLAVIENGKVITELVQTEAEEGEGKSGISYEGKLPDHKKYSITSAGHDFGNSSSILIDDEECSAGGEGLNITLYDNKLKKVTDNTSFNTGNSATRGISDPAARLSTLLDNGATLADLTGTERNLYLYDRACENKEIAGQARLDDGGLTSYLDTFWDDEDIDIYITVQNDGSRVLTDDDRKSLEDLGLVKLSGIEYGRPYVAVVNGGKVALEETEESNSLDKSSNIYDLFSAGNEERSTSFVMINGEKYFGTDGIQVVIYDNLTQMVVDSITFESDSSVHTVGVTG